MSQILKIPSEAERHKWIQNFDAPKLLTQVDKDKEKNLPNYIFKAKVIRAFNGHCPWELSINENDIINVTDDKDHGNYNLHIFQICQVQVYYYYTNATTYTNKDKHIYDYEFEKRFLINGFETMIRDNKYQFSILCTYNHKGFSQ